MQSGLSIFDYVFIPRDVISRLVGMAGFEITDTEEIYYKAGYRFKQAVIVQGVKLVQYFVIMAVLLVLYCVLSGVVDLGKRESENFL